MAEWITLVDDNDISTGFAEKIYVHKRALLHRAFSVFVVNKYDGKILLQKRSKGKYHSGGLWSNTCCSHQYKDEFLFDAVRRRLNQELGISLNYTNIDDNQRNSDSVNCKISEIGVFRYFKQFSNLAENEIDHVFLVTVNEEHLDMHINHDEVEEIKWETHSHITNWMKQSPNDFTAWFEGAYLLLCNMLVSRGI